MEKYRELDLFTLELGNGFCSKRSLDETLKTVALLRDEIFEQFGVVIPSIQVKNNSQLKSLEYVIKVNGLSAGEFVFKRNSLMLVNTGNVKSEIEGKLVDEPVFGIDALMIPVSKREEAVKKGYVVLTLQRILQTHLREIIKENLSSVITTQYVTELLEDINSKNKSLYSFLFKKYESMTLQIVKDILKSLLDEEVSIRNILPILETIADAEKSSKMDTSNILRKVRSAIAPNIIAPFLKNNHLDFVLISPDFSNYLLAHESELKNFVYDSSIRAKFIDELSKVNNKTMYSGIVCHSASRKALKNYLENICLMPKVPVFSEVEFINAIKKMNFESNMICEIGKGIINQKDEQPNKETTCDENKKESNAKNNNPEFSKEAFSKLKKNVRDVLENLPPLEQKILVMRFGLDDGCTHSLEQIEEALDVSKEEIRRIEAKVLRMLRHPRNDDRE